MVKTVDKQELARLVGVVEGKLAQQPQDTDSNETRVRFHHAGEIALASLVIQEGARERHDYAGWQLSLGGIKSTCTYGAHGVMHNWLTAARRQLEVQP